jgi:hypothetical protein
MTKTEDILGEFAGAPLPDKRLRDRLGVIAGALAERPDVSFPEMVSGGSDLEALYRFFRNPRVTSEAVLQPHIDATVERVAQVRTALAIHDTTECRFPGESPRQGLGALKTKGQGFEAHIALAVGFDEGPMPLGVLGVRTIFREKFAYRKTRKAKGYFDPKKESNRWPELVDLCNERLADVATEVVHVMDREADWYELLQKLVAAENKFVVRLSHDRRLAEPDGKLLSEALGDARWFASREVMLSRRRKGDRGFKSVKMHPPREARVAQVAISAKSVCFQVPAKLRPNKALARRLCLNVIEVREVNTPAKEDPVNWILVTNLPISNEKNVLRIVDIYRCRWLIEEFFKALKTGCALERRQLETGHALLNVFAASIPIAWQMLALRATARIAPELPASLVLTVRQIRVLRAMTRRPLPAALSIEDALYAVAGLGGHLRHNGPPGWQTLAKGVQALLLFERGWNAATDRRRM